MHSSLSVVSVVQGAEPLKSLRGADYTDAMTQRAQPLSVPSVVQLVGRGAVRGYRITEALKDTDYTDAATECTQSDHGVSDWGEPECVADMLHQFAIEKDAGVVMFDKPQVDGA